MESVGFIGVSVTFMTLLGLLLATLLVVASRRFYVFEDPRIDQVEELLPRANCGACGTAGCRPFAEGLIQGAIKPSQCTVNTPAMNLLIANFLGVELGSQEKRVARLACAGGAHVAEVRAAYGGLKSCRAAALVAGGGKGCTWGCLGMGDCAEVCEFDAITMDRFGLPVVEESRCTACGDCVDVCPKDLFSLQPVSRRLWVACRNRDFGDEAEAQCEVICTACGRCAADSPEGLVTIEGNLAQVNYAKNALASEVAIERCPTGAIVWLEKGGQVTKGRDARRIVRKEPRPLPTSC